MILLKVNENDLPTLGFQLAVFCHVSVAFSIGHPFLIHSSEASPEI